MKNTVINENINLDSLNPAQRKVVLDMLGPMLVVAGAGSGKTRVLTLRVAYLISQGVSPYNIMAVTFTNKAATEMKARLSQILGEETVKKIWIGTFHSICGRILRQDIDKLGTGLEKNFVITDESAIIAHIKQAIKELNLDVNRYKPKAVYAAISNAKNAMITAREFCAKADDYYKDVVGKIYTKYEELLIKNNTLDFDDMLMLTVKLLEKSPEVAQKFQERFSHILVDEYQDTNTAQYRFIKSLVNYGNNPWTDTSLCVVGDVDQSIYSWRGADYKIILNFQEDFPEAKIHKLEQNYRSVQCILDVANSIITNNTERMEKNLYCTKGKGTRPVLYQANDETEEAMFVAQQIKKLMEKGHTYNQFGILYRTNSQSRVLEEVMLQRKIPYKLVGSIKFYERKEIKDIVAYLKVIYNSSDSQSIKRVINEPKRSVGKTTMEKIDKIFEQNQLYCYFDILKDLERHEGFTPRTIKSVKDFVNVIERVKLQLENWTLPELIQNVALESGYVAMLRAENSAEAESRLENIDELINVAAEFVANGYGNNLGDFLTQMSLVSDLDQLPEEQESVTLMTLHAAKGLEFPIVFLTGLEEGIFPHFRSLENATEMEEERRLMYVGITRAEDNLFMTYSQKRRLHGDYKYFIPSRFIKEIPTSYLENYNVTDKKMAEGDYSTSFNRGFRSYGGSNYGAGSRSSYNNSAHNEPDTSRGFGRDFVAPTTASSAATTNVTPTRASQSTSTASGFKSARKAAKEATTQNPETQNPISPNSPEQPLNIKKDYNISLTENFEIKIEKKKAPIGINIDSTQNGKGNSQAGKAQEVFVSGDKVAHPRFGIGEVEKVIEVGGNTIYSVIFEDSGKKALDARSAKLEKK